MGIVNALIFVFIIIFPLGQVTRFPLTTTLAITLSDIVLLFLFAAWLFEIIIKKRKDIFHHVLFQPIFLVIAVMVFSLVVQLGILNPDQFFIAFSYILRWVLYISLFFILSSLPADIRKRLPFYILLSGAVTIAGGYLQYFLYPDLRNLYYLGWDEHLYRMFGSFLDPNFFGAFLVIYFFFLLEIYLQKKNMKLSRKMILIGLGCMTILAVFLTYSRSAFLMLLVSLFVFVFLYFRYHDSNHSIRKIGFVFLGLIIFCVSFIFLISQFSQSEGTNIFRINSSLARIDSYQKAWEIFRENPILGVGFNAYRFAQERYGFISKEDIIHSGSGTDNSFLFILATTGIVGFAAFGNLWLAIIKKSQSLIFISLVLGLFVNAFFINSLFFPSIIEWMVFLWIFTKNS